ncbi:hypothetical protein F7Q99_30915 [Streptomyces kaniharaensis]|uniref:Uncharacterized protein n=1 Tax=Streptomyces kaniharaensis TaxID=212423 RepID=A0A6N7L1V8_9ACTN|nr:hypothetical protein [Streptomyces kaniharaensis]MQS16488.1 hypothetical protein [Streptomyces kaniharaensis]
MSTRVKKTLLTLVQGTVLTALLSVHNLTKPGHLEITPWTVLWMVVWVAIAGYTWWFYGDSEKAVALQAKVEAKKAARRTSRQG